MVEVAFGNDKLWSIPQEMSAQLYDKYVNGQDAVYTWDWEKADVLDPGSRIVN